MTDLIYTGDHAGGLAEAEQALAISPSLAIAHREFGAALVLSGHRAEGSAALVCFAPIATNFVLAQQMTRWAMSRQRTPEVTASLAVTLALHIVHVRPRIWDEAICVRHPHLRECLCVEDSLLRQDVVYIEKIRHD